MAATHLHAERSIEEIRKQTQLRWFSAAEIREIFANTERLDILIFQRQERPPSGSFFGIKRDMVREFKKDGHNWTKKKDGKTVQEAHQKLKLLLSVGNVNILQCLYAHGQDNKNFRSIYWMLDREASDIALFHYREAKGIRENCEQSSQKTEENPSIGIADDGGFQLPMPYAELEDTYLYSRQDTYLYSPQEIEEASDLPDPGAPGSPSALQEMYHRIDNEDRPCS